MPLHTEQSGTPSRVFGKGCPYPLDGKSVLYEFADSFAAEFNQRARLYLKDQHGGDRLDSYVELKVTGAYPTSKQHCPRIAILRTNCSPRALGIGGEAGVVRSDKGDVWVRGQTVTDTLEVAICTLNDRLRDDLFIWFQQYLLDAIAWALPQLGTVSEINCVGGSDDQVEYQGTQGQPGFEFYVASLQYRVTYDLLVMRDVDRIASIFNWQYLDPVIQDV